MASKVAKKGSFSVRAHRGDAKTLLAFNLSKADTKNLAGFSIHCQPDGKPGFFLLNSLQFEKPADHAQDATLPPNSSFNAPLHKFRWVHVPGSGFQGPKPFFGKYTYTVTPRYFDAQRSMLPLDAARSVSVSVEVAPFVKKKLAVGFTRGFVQSQAFVRHFGPKATIRPKNNNELLFDTSAQAGIDPKGKPYTFAQEYDWLGFTARERIFEVIDEVIATKSLRLDVFAYDLNEPDVAAKLLTLAKQGRLRIVLDNASLHKSTATKTSAEDAFEKLFPAPKKPTDPPQILRKHFKRFSHDKIFIVSKGKTARRVLTGATNLSVTGFYVNSNHVLIYNDAKVAAKYAEMFETVWTQQASAAKFIGTELSQKSFTFTTGVPATEITFAPHDAAGATKVLDAIVARIKKEGSKPKSDGSVLFAIMELAKATGPVFPALKSLHADQTIFSYGISDNPGGIVLYKPTTKQGILVTGKPGKTQLPPPFNQVPGIGGHQIHHKFVVCGFNGSDPTVYCGSSNLALGGEQENGDNLLTIRDADIATVFAIEAVALVDHFHFLNTVAKKAGATTPTPPPAAKVEAAVQAGFFLGTTDAWVKPYYDSQDIHSADRLLFA